MDSNTIDKNTTIFPVMGKRLDTENSLKMDFSANNKKLAAIDLSNTSLFNDFVFSQLQKQTYGYGGYLENRVIYLRSTHFQSGASRSIHLGVDIWANAFHPIYAPLDAKVHSFRNNDNYGDYGPTIILEHHINEQLIYTLYGHLSVKSLEQLEVGATIKQGEAFCELGPFPENGDWPPHLHFQLITDMEGRTGDFPGVCAPDELLHYKKICLNPYSFI
jgi:murein DD-endopeptidase MepM/ murein hydrolase activator NlpD